MLAFDKVIAQAAKERRREHEPLVEHRLPHEREQLSLLVAQADLLDLPKQLVVALGHLAQPALGPAAAVAGVFPTHFTGLLVP